MYTNFQKGGLSFMYLTTRALVIFFWQLEENHSKVLLSQLGSAKTGWSTYNCSEITIEDLDPRFRGFHGFHVWRHLTGHLHSENLRPEVDPSCQPVRKTKRIAKTMQLNHEFQLVFSHIVSNFLSPVTGLSRCDGYTMFFKEENVQLQGGKDMAV